MLEFGSRHDVLTRGPEMKIAQIAPLFESVPPRLYGGTERVVSYLAEELVHQGHQVTLFASADSVTCFLEDRVGTSIPSGELLPTYAPISYPRRR